MKVILSQDVKGQGKKGQMVEVSDGYARNYLLPRKLAIEASAQNVNVMREKQASADFKKATEIKNAKETAQKLSELKTVVTAKGGENGKLFGSVTSKEIADAILKQHGVDVDRRKIVLAEPIKNAGEYELAVKLYTDIQAKIKIEVKTSEK